MNYELAYRIGFHPWEDAERQPAFGKRLAALVSREERASPPYGAALDLGTGSGIWAIWLAQRGWQVTAMDVSQLALERARGAAAKAGAEIANRITWLHQDVLTWNDAGAQFDLVSAQYLHFTRDNVEVHRRLATLVRPGGSLLIVGQHPSHIQGDQHHESALNHKDLLFEPEAAAAALDPAEWQVQLAAIIERQPSSAHRQSGVMKDTVLLARRS